MSRRIVPQIFIAALVLALATGCTPIGGAVPTDTPASIASGSPTPSATPTPTAAAIVLGSAANFNPSAKGFGQPKPATIFLGGDPTGLVTDITWNSWGGATANGTGTAVDAAHSTVASAPHEQATIVAFDPRVCNGVLMYNQLVWYFPEGGGTFAKAVSQFGSQSVISQCSGN